MCLVEIATGTLTLEQVDARLDGAIPLEMFRYYRAAAPRLGDLGYGWGHAFGYRLWVEDRETIGFLGGDGRRFLLATPGNGQTSKLAAEGLAIEHVPAARLPSKDLRDRLAGGALVVHRNGLGSLLFNATGRLEWLAFVHASGVLTRVVAGADGLPGRLLDVHGRELELGRREDGMLLAVDLKVPGDAKLPLARYAYSDADDLIAVLTGAGVRRFEYDAAHHLIAHWNLAGEVCRSEYDEGGRCVHTWGASGAHDRRYLYDDALLATVVTDGRGAERTYQRNHAGQLISSTDPLGHRSTFEYDAEGRLVQATDACGHVTTVLYDATGGAAGKVDPAGNAWSVSYGPGTVVSSSPCGAKTIYGVRGDGLISSLSAGGRKETRFAYGADGRVSALVLPDGKRIDLRWSSDGRDLEESAPDGLIATRRFDLLGRLVEQTLVGSAVTKYAHDAGGHLSRVEYPDATVRRYVHDREGRLTGLVDEAGNQTRWELDGAGRRIVCRGANGDVHRVAFDQDDRILAIRMPGALEHRYDYDLRGKVVAQRFADGRQERYQWDPCGLPTGLADASGVVVRASYDAASRPIDFAYADSRRKRITYDKDGRWLSIDFDGHVQRRELTDAGDAVTEWQDDLMVKREFDDQRRCRVVADSLGLRVEYGRGDDGNVVSVAIGRTSGCAGIRTHRFSHDRRGNRLQWATPAGTIESRVFDLRDRMRQQRIEHEGRLVVERRYEYDPLGRMVQMIDSRRGRFDYRYDAIGRLIGASRSGQWVTYDWTPAGGVVLPASEYDPGGRLVRARDWRLEYDNRGFVTRRISAAREDRFDHSSGGLLMGVAGSDGARHRFHYDGHSRLLQWSGGSARRFLWDRDSLRACFDATNDGPTTWFVSIAGDLQPIEQIEGERAFSVHSDHNGRVCELIAADGSVAWENRAGVWGELDRKSAGVTVAAMAGVDETRAECPFGLPGQFTHAPTGLLYNRNRWYFAETAHYLEPDPSGIWGGLDGYAYAHDPVNLNDPLGLQCRGKADDPTLYRGDRRPPEQICGEGFRQWDPQGAMSLLEHVNGGNESSPWISTAHDRSSAVEAAGFGDRKDDDVNRDYPGRAGPWVYELENPGCGHEVDCDPGVIAHQAEIGLSSTENEIAFRKPIPPANIVGAVNQLTGEVFMCP